MKYIKFNLTFLIIFIGLNYIYFNFGKNKFNFQIESFLKENLKKAVKSARLKNAKLKS